MLPTLYQDFIYLRTYSRWREDLKRRETWDETVTRYLDFFKEKSGVYSSDGRPSNGAVHPDIYNELLSSILHLEVMPSMRSLAAAGPA